MACGSTFTLMATIIYNNVTLDVCEELHLNGSIAFLPRGLPRDRSDDRSVHGFPLTLRKYTLSNLPAGDVHRYVIPGGNFTAEQVLNFSTDLLGNGLLAQQGEPLLVDVWHAMPPLRHLGSWGGQGARVWTGARGSAVDLVLDENGENHLSGAPFPKLVAARLPGPVSSRFNFEGLVAGPGFGNEGTETMPVVVLGFPVERSAATEQREAAEVAALHEQMERAVNSQRYAVAAALASRVGSVRRGDIVPAPSAHGGAAHAASDGGDGDGDGDGGRI